MDKQDVLPLDEALGNLQKQEAAERRFIEASTKAREANEARDAANVQLQAYQNVDGDASRNYKPFKQRASSPMSKKPSCRPKILKHSSRSRSYRNCGKPS